jgi:hypothetical protein
MPWGTAIFLTLLLSAIGWPLLHTSPKKNEEERSAIVLEFAHTLTEHPELARHDSRTRLNEAPPSTPATGPSARTFWSGRKNLPSRPHTLSNETVKVHLNSGDSLEFGSRSEWQQWIHEGIEREGSNFLQRIDVDADLTGFLATIEFIHQTERNKTVLRDVNRLAIQVTSRILLDSQSPDHELAVSSLESLIRQAPEDPETVEIERILREYRARK